MERITGKWYSDNSICFCFYRNSVVTEAESERTPNGSRKCYGGTLRGRQELGETSK